MSFKSSEIGSLEFIPLQNHIKRQRQRNLEESLLSRLSRSALADKGILDDSVLVCNILLH